MGKARFLCNNLITAESMIVASSLKLGVVTTALKEGTGGAVIVPSGDFTGAVDLEYVVEIDGLGTGEIGSSTFKWSDDGGATWDATTVATAHTPTALNNGVSVAWPDHAAGADFVLADKWYFKGINLYNPGKMLDFDRDSRYRSLNKTVTQTITITFASEQQINALVIGDHNFASWTLHLWGDDAATFDSGGGGAPQVDETITFAVGTVLHYLTTSDRVKKYWRLQITAGTSADAYFEIGELFLGSYLEFSRNYKIGFGEDPGLLMDTNITSYGVDRDRFYNEQKNLRYDFAFMPSADLTLKRALVSALGSGSTGIFRRFWFNADSATPSDVILAKLISWPHTHAGSTYYNMPLTMREVVKSI